MLPTPTEAAYGLSDLILHERYKHKTVMPQMRGVTLVANKGFSEGSNLRNEFHDATHIWQHPTIWFFVTCHAVPSLQP